MVSMIVAMKDTSAINDNDISNISDINNNSIHLLNKNIFSKNSTSYIVKNVLKHSSFILILFNKRKDVAD